MLLAIRNRILKCLLEILVWIDIGLGLIICIPFYVILGHPAPCAYTTISAVVGSYSNQGFTWAKIAEYAIDRMFFMIEGKMGHCQRSIRKENR
jgi:hypothetical protein